VNRIFALTKTLPLNKKNEIAFVTIFSVVILVTFYLAISMNGVVLGNDPAVHLEKAMIFLNTGEISLANLGWTPPLLPKTGPLGLEPKTGAGLLPR
jgi:hypothetical protein